MSEQIKVITYSGRRGEESPRAFFLGEEKIEVVEIIRTWLEETIDTRVRMRYFTVTGSDGLKHTLAHDEELAMWFHR